jgi:hypothetical protein
MTLEEQIEKEREKNDSLALEIENSKAKAHSLWPSQIFAAMAAAGPLKELCRQKKESDQRLAALKRKKQGSAEGRASIHLMRHPLNSKPDIAKRRAIVHQKSKLSSEDLCKRFDLDDVRLPVGWIERFNVSDWRRAYQNKKCRRLIHKLISVDKRKAR